MTGWLSLYVQEAETEVAKDAACRVVQKGLCGHTSLWGRLLPGGKAGSLASIPSHPPDVSQGGAWAVPCSSCSTVAALCPLLCLMKALKPQEFSCQAKKKQTHFVASSGWAKPQQRHKVGWPHAVRKHQKLFLHYKPKELHKFMWYLALSSDNPLLISSQAAGNGKSSSSWSHSGTSQREGTNA